MDSRTEFQQRCLRFSANVLGFVTRLPKNPTTRVISDQLLRSGTSVGANVREARAAESRADFVHKMQIALKEAGEAAYWLELIEFSKLVDDSSLQALSKEVGGNRRDYSEIRHYG
jgi:four helix bundle protein